uniref:DegT/DnrJ/EryC1/StrS aminotransferase family protein n=1 Tax=Zooxanthella nutricula TaxID=1333877 RepID=A0A7S2PJ77_9DINO
MADEGKQKGAATMQEATTVGKMWNPSLYIGSIVADPQDRVGILPPRIKESMPSPEPKPGPSGWLYRVLEPYYSRECVDNVMQAMLGGQISSGAAWPRRLAEQICALYGVPVALPTSSGASALHVALLACDLGPQDHVLVPSFTMVAVANMVKMVGAKPLYCDCAPGSLNPGREELLQKATPRTKAIIVCHTYGVACKDIRAIAALCKERGWWLIEDICEAMGTKDDGGDLVGTFGDFAVSSLYANKPITAGDGGWVHARDPKHHDRLKSLINHGFDPAYHFLHFETAPNAKMNGLGAAFVCSQVRELPKIMEQRGQLAAWYREELVGLQDLKCMEQRKVDAPWVFGIETKDRKTRDSLRDHLAARGVETRNYFFPLHLEPVNFYGSEVGVYDVVLPNAEHAAQVGFYLPTHYFLERADVVYISGLVKEFYSQSEPSSKRHAPEARVPRSIGWADAERSRILSAPAQP